MCRQGEKGLEEHVTELARLTPEEFGALPVVDEKGLEADRTELYYVKELPRSAADEEMARMIRDEHAAIMGTESPRTLECPYCGHTTTGRGIGSVTCGPHDDGTPARLMREIVLPVLDEKGIVVSGECPACHATPGYSHKMSRGYGAGHGITISKAVAASLRAESVEKCRPEGTALEQVYMPDSGETAKPLISATYTGTIQPLMQGHSMAQPPSAPASPGPDAITPGGDPAPALTAGRDEDPGIVFRPIRWHQDEDGVTYDEIELLSISIGEDDFDLQPGWRAWGDQGLILRRRS